MPVLYKDCTRIWFDTQRVLHSATFFSASKPGCPTTSLSHPDVLPIVFMIGDYTRPTDVVKSSTPRWVVSPYKWAWPVYMVPVMPVHVYAIGKQLVMAFSGGVGGSGRVGRDNPAGRTTLPMVFDAYNHAQPHDDHTI